MLCGSSHEDWMGQTESESLKKFEPGIDWKP